MAILKCKMCGGDLVIVKDSTVCECEYCGSKQTVPLADDDRKLTLYERANRLRFNCEFDKAASVYENIVSEYHEEAEAYWGMVLCRFGIEYVDDPTTGKKVPTCHRSSFDSVMDDADFDMVMENSDEISRGVYREEAKKLEEIRKGIIEVSGKEEPYDIFICYKETAPDGQRTLDSVLAQDIYEELVNKGYRVFFSRITLEDKLGTEYEPYIFAALNSAKIMLAFGTSYDNYNAVWVKNEWSRYLKLMIHDKSKHLIPCFKDIDAYDIPKEFSKLQAQDLGKVGATQDLLRGIEKIIGTAAAATTVQNQAGGFESILKRGFVELEYKDWSKAEKCFEEALNHDVQCAEAYLGKLLIDCKISSPKELANLKRPFDENGNYRRAIRFGKSELIDELNGYLNVIRARNDEERKKEEARLEYERKRKIYDAALKKADAQYYEAAINELSGLGDFEDAADQIIRAKEKIYEAATGKMSEGRLDMALSYFKSISDFRDSAEKIREVTEIQEAERAEQQRQRQARLKEETEIAEQYESLRKEIKVLQDRKASLGIFAGKEKKEINGKLQQLEAECESLGEQLKSNPRLFSEKSDIIRFGHYEASNEWKVILKDDTRLLAISRYAIAVQPYHCEEGNTSWEMSSLRRWLNNEFYEAAFDSGEQHRLLFCKVDNVGNTIFDTKGGRDTTDKVFLLSEEEVKLWMKKDDERQAVLPDNKPIWWWLRSPGESTDMAAYVDEKGAVLDYGDSTQSIGGVRPAVWIDISEK